MMRVVCVGEKRFTAILIHRIWPLFLSFYLVMLALSPHDLPIYGFTSRIVTDTAMYLAGALVITSFFFPDQMWVSAGAMASTSWIFMGRAISFAFGQCTTLLCAPSDEAFWSALLGSSVYLLLTLAVVIIYFVHVVLTAERVARRGQ